MNYYIQNNEFYILSEPLGDGYDLSETNSLEDFKAGKIILLNEAQVAFKEANPNATTIEVFNTELTPPQVLTFEQLKARKIEEIEAYDTSEAVNAFKMNGVTMWLDRNTRASLLATIAAYKANNLPDITLWTTTSNPMALTLTVTQLEDLLTNLELYAKQCYDTTATHKRNIQQLTDIQQIVDYDYTAGYPEKLNITVNEQEGSNTTA